MATFAGICKIMPLCVLSLLITVFPANALAHFLPRYLRSSPPCSFFPANFSSLQSSEEQALSFPIEYTTRDIMTLFNRSSFDLHAGSSFTTAFTFTFTFTSHRQEWSPTQTPTLAFILAPTSAEFAYFYGMELTFTCNEMDNTSQTQTHTPPLPFCKSRPLSLLQTPLCTCRTSSDEDPQPAPLKDDVSLEYIASTGELHVQASHYDSEDEKVTNLSLAFITIYNFQLNESATLFVGYITNGEANITLTNYEFTSTTPHIRVSASFIHHYDIRLLWILLGTLLVAFMIGLTILLLLMKKHIEDRRLKEGSCLPKHGVTPIGRSLQPYLEDSEMPIMNSLPLTPPRYNAFQVSGTMSWLKQPNPR